MSLRFFLEPSINSVGSVDGADADGGVRRMGIQMLGGSHGDLKGFTSWPGWAHPAQSCVYFEPGFFIVITITILFYSSACGGVII